MAASYGYEYAWHFEISAEAEFAQDENGSPAPCLTRVKISFNKPLSDEAYAEMAPKVATSIAEQLDIPTEWLTLISKKEYEDRTDDEDEVIEDEE